MTIREYSNFDELFAISARVSFDRGEPAGRRGKYHYFIIRVQYIYTYYIKRASYVSTNPQNTILEHDVIREGIVHRNEIHDDNIITHLIMAGVLY